MYRSITSLCVLALVLATGCEQAPARTSKAKTPTLPVLTEPAQGTLTGLRIGNVAPDWAAKDHEGTSFRLSDQRGKVVILDFWATWCNPCLRSMPGLQRIHENFQSRGVVVVGMNGGERDPNATPYELMKRMNLTYTCLLHTDHVGQAYQVRSIPTFYVIGTDGVIVDVHVGVIDEGKLSNTLDDYLSARGL